MTDEPQRQSIQDIQVDRDNLYQEEVFTDLRVATMRRLTPITVDGEPDPSRPVVFAAETQLMSQMGPVPVSAKIEAKTLAEAIEKFPAAIQEAIERMMEEAREMQRREASRIVVPGAGGGPPAGRGGAGGQGPLVLG